MTPTLPSAPRSGRTPGRRTLLVVAVLTAVLAAAWVGYALGGGALGRWVAARFGGALAALGEGKFDRVDVFVTGRLREALVLATVAVAFVVVDALVWPAVRRRLAGRPLGWVVPAGVVFAQLNVFAAVAMGTVALWLGLWTGHETSHPRVPFEIKARLMSETAPPTRVVLLGSSQMGSQVDEALLADTLGARAWVAELSYQGVTPVDLLLVQRRLRARRPDVAVVYLSELSLYNGVPSERYTVFLSPAGRRDLDRLGVTALDRPDIDNAVWYARVAQALPLFDLREPLTDRLLGREVRGLAQAQYNVDLEPDLDVRADAMAQRFTPPDAPEARIQKRALATFVARAAADGMPVVLLAGMVSPRLRRRLPPTLRADFLATLDALARRYPGVRVVGPDAMPVSPESGFEDLTHVREAEKLRGTRQMLPALVGAVDAALGAAPSRPAASRPAAGT